MCLTMIVRVREPLGDRITEILREGDLSISEQKDWRSKPTGLLMLSESGEGCACSMLTDDADWGGPHLCQLAGEC